MSGRFNLNDYVTVDERIDKFWARYPNGAIRTEMLYTNNDGSNVAIKASVYKDWEHPHSNPDATGIAQELQGGMNANKSSWWENCETSAIGRALANLGMSISKQRPSREEMAKVQRYQDEDAQPSPTSINDALANFDPRRPQESGKRKAPLHPNGGFLADFDPRRPQDHPQRPPHPADDGFGPAPTEHPLLATIRDDNADPKAREKALHNYMMSATTLAQLAECVTQVSESGMPEATRDKARVWHNERITTGKAPAPKAPAPTPAD